MTALAEASSNRLAENVGALMPIPRGRAIVQYHHLLTFVSPPSYSRHTTPARQHHSVPVVRWFAGYEGLIQQGKPQPNPDRPQKHIRFIQLGCHESENLYLTDEVLAAMGLNWAAAQAKILAVAELWSKSARTEGSSAAGPEGG